MNGRMPVLLRLFSRGVLVRSRSVFVVLGVLLVPMLGIHWNGSGLELWGVAFETAGPYTRESALSDYLRELFSWWWIHVGLAYLLPVVLLATVASFSRDQVLWLRMTPCSARELALARLGRVVFSLLLIGSIGLAAAFGVAQWHDTTARGPAWTVGGMLAHGLWSAGALLLVGPYLQTPIDRALGAFFCFLAPVVAFLVFVALEPKLPGSVREWWPYTVPFARLSSDPGPHILSAAALGVAGMFLSVLLQPGHRRSPDASTTGS
jgi:uncharacterized membrane protein YhaH (DUF805 family)